MTHYLKHTSVSLQHPVLIYDLANNSINSVLSSELSGLKFQIYMPHRSLFMRYFFSFFSRALIT